MKKVTNIFMSSTRSSPNASNALLWASVAWTLVLASIFVAHRQADLLSAGSAISLFNQGFAGFDLRPLRDSALGLLSGALVVLSWIGYGSVVHRAIRKLTHGDQELGTVSWNAGIVLAYGAGLSSLLWFVLGLLHVYRPLTAAVFVVGGVALAIPAVLRLHNEYTLFSLFHERTAGILLLATIIPILLAAFASLAPPTAKDTLLYHISLPRAFVTAGGLVDVPLNIAQYYALGAELNGASAMLLGDLANARVGEAAFGFVQLAYLPILTLVTFGWMRNRGATSASACLATALVTSVPTMYASASGGYNDLALALYVTLAIASAADWWTLPNRRSAAEIGLAVGFALGVKLLALFLVPPLLIVFLLKLREIQHKSDQLGRVFRTALFGLLLAGAVAAPWYVRNWARTGSPVFPFYMNILHGSAPGWDEQRSFYDQLSNATYGGYPKSALDYAAVPVRVFLTAQFDEPSAFDGVVGFSFLTGAPLVLLAYIRKQLPANWIVSLSLAVSWFFFWMFSSEQIRYLLPALPALAATMVVAATSLDQRLTKILWATTVPVLLVIIIWFAQQNPLAVVIGAESRDHYLARAIDHYNTYAAANQQLPPDARVWLVDVRGDTYYIQRPYLSEFRIEHTFPQLVIDSTTVDDLRASVRSTGVTHLLIRTNILLNYQISQLVDDRLSREDNERRLQRLRDFLRTSKVLHEEQGFVLVEL